MPELPGAMRERFVRDYGLPEYDAAVLTQAKAMAKSTSEFKSARNLRPGQSGEMVSTRLQPDLLAEIDAWRREQPDLPSRPEALRRLAVKGLRSSREKS
jgi:aspartyl-tRNA(Asn)/glutamyl-tRNA(Gln) amidotransferase subunit B